MVLHSWVLHVMPDESIDDLFTLRRYVELAHHIPGRLRLRFTNRLVASLSQGKLKQLDTLCHPQGCLRRYQLHKDSGSIVLEYDVSRVPPRIFNQLFGSDGELASVALHELAAILDQTY